MLHLAQVRKNPTSGEIELQLLAKQKSDSLWELCHCETLLIESEKHLQLGILVLVECDQEGQIIYIQEAKDWVLNLLCSRYDSKPSASELVEEEQVKIEQWRQEITSQSLEINRRSLEIETHREQLQELEQTLKQEREQLQKEQQKFQQLKGKSF